MYGGEGKQRHGNLGLVASEQLASLGPWGAYQNSEVRSHVEDWTFVWQWQPDRIFRKWYRELNTLSTLHSFAIPLGELTLQPQAMLTVCKPHLVASGTLNRTEKGQQENRRVRRKRCQRGHFSGYVEISSVSEKIIYGTCSPKLPS